MHFLQEGTQFFLFYASYDKSGPTWCETRCNRDTFLKLDKPKNGGSMETSSIPLEVSKFA